MAIFLYKRVLGVEFRPPDSFVGCCLDTNRKEKGGKLLGWGGFRRDVYIHLQHERIPHRKKGLDEGRHA